MVCETFLVTGKVFYKVYVKNGDPYVRRIDPRTLIWDKSSTNRLFRRCYSGLQKKDGLSDK